jgi:peptidoglycan/xylan/chitin deacetylase (PgdA/CDA1 family)
MTSIDRRNLLRAIAIAIVAASGSGCAPLAGAHPVRPKIPVGRQPAGELRHLVGAGNQLALTVDDGKSVDVVAAYAAFCRDSGTRLTFFVNGVHESWTVNAPALRPMVDSGQIQLANHTWSHPDVTQIGPDEVAEQIRRNREFLVNTYGVDGTPYFRPPYGHHNNDTDRIAADFGYPSIAMWSSSIEDSQLLEESQLIANAENCFKPEQIVLAHANLPPVTHCYGQLLDIIHSRGLQTVTLNDVFG